MVDFQNIARYGHENKNREKEMKKEIGMGMDFFRNWRPTGWFGQDLTLYILYGVLAIILAGFVYRMARRSRASSKPVHLKSNAIVLAAILLFGFLAGSLVLLTFNGAGRGVRVELDSKAVVAEQDGRKLVVNKMRMIIPNGQSNGISTSVSRFETIAVDLRTGENAWHRRSAWHESLIGNTKAGILTINTRKEKLFFVDPMTGETVLTEEEWLERYPRLRGNLSYVATDYYVASENELYLYALDGKYYKVDFSLEEMTENAAYQDVLSDAFFSSSSLLDMPSDEVWEMTRQLDAMYPELLEKTVLHAESGGRNALVGYLEKRNDKVWTLALLSLDNREVQWTVKTDAPQGMPGSSYAALKAGDTLLFYCNGKLYPINMETGTMNYTYQYRWNQAIHH